MPDLAAISAALGSIKTATEIAKYFRESDFNLEKAELKHKLADLVSALAEVKMELVEVQDEMIQKDKIIAELREALETKDDLARRYDAYYKKDKEGNPIGVPYCLRCWEVEHKMRQLVHDPKDHRTTICTGCGQRYEGRMSSEILPKKKG